MKLKLMKFFSSIKKNLYNVKIMITVQRLNPDINLIYELSCLNFLSLRYVGKQDGGFN